MYSAYENKTITINQEGLYIDIQVRADVLNSWPLYTSAEVPPKQLLLKMRGFSLLLVPLVLLCHVHLSWQGRPIRIGAIEDRSRPPWM